MNSSKLAVPSHVRPSKPEQSKSGGSLRIPGLPRYHPSNYPSTDSDYLYTSVTGGVNSPQPQQRQGGEAAKHPHSHHRELYTLGGRPHSRSSSTGSYSKFRPVSPRLDPTGSPGPVTPLWLEEQEEYLGAGARSPRSSGPPGLNDPSQQERLDRLMREEARRQRDSSPRRDAANSSRYGRGA